MSRSTMLVLRVKSEGISHCTLDDKALNVINDNNVIVESFDTSRLLKYVLNVPVYFKNMIEREYITKTYILESPNVNLRRLHFQDERYDDYPQEEISPEQAMESIEEAEENEEEDIPSEEATEQQTEAIEDGPQSNNVYRSEAPVLMANFELAKKITMQIFLIQIGNCQYYDILLYNETRSLFDLMIDPSDIMFVDIDKDEFYTLEKGHLIYRFHSEDGSDEKVFMNNRISYMDLFKIKAPVEIAKQ